MSGLAVAQHGLSVTAANVTNANTEGYTRKLAHQEAVIVDGRGAGAQATDITRVVDDYLGARIMEQAGRLGRSEVLSNLHARIEEQLFGAPGDADRGLGNRISQLAAAAETLAGAPGKAALATSFLGAAQDLVAEIARAGDEVQSLRRELDQEIGRTVGAANGEILALHQLNGEIARGGGSPDLLDRRDTLLTSLAGRIEISVADEGNGTVAIYTRGGQPLLEGTPRQLVYEPAATVGPDTTFGAIRLHRSADVDPATGRPSAGATGAELVSGGVRAEATPELLADGVADARQLVVSPFRSGRLQGLLEARDRVLPTLADQLGELAGLVSHTLNAAHNAAVPQPPLGQLTGTRTDTAGFATASRSGTAYLAIIDRASGATAATLAIDIGAATDAAYLAARITTGLGAYGSASLDAQGALQITLGSGYGIALAEGDSAITVTDAAGRERSFGLAHYFGLNDLIVADGSQPTRLAVRPDIAADSQLLSRARLDVTPGSPPDATLGGAGDNRGAQALAAAFETSLATAARGALPAGSWRAADYAAEIVATTAVAAERALGTEASDRALAEDLETRRASISGVNLDEELSKLVLYQQAYGVSARLVSITNDLFDDLLAIAG
jgi:flagellar hook-associated protein 1 FlgK